MPSCHAVKNVLAIGNQTFIPPSKPARPFSCLASCATPLHHSAHLGSALLGKGTLPISSSHWDKDAMAWAMGIGGRSLPSPLTIIMAWNTSSPSMRTPQQPCQNGFFCPGIHLAFSKMLTTYQRRTRPPPVAETNRESYVFDLLAMTKYLLVFWPNMQKKCFGGTNKIVL